jgi:hypothetical protein
LFLFFIFHEHEHEAWGMRLHYHANLHFDVHVSSFWLLISNMPSSPLLFCAPLPLWSWSAMAIDSEFWILNSEFWIQVATKLNALVYCSFASGPSTKPHAPTYTRSAENTSAPILWHLTDFEHFSPFFFQTTR